MKLAISLASRGRPQQLVETVVRSVANWRHPNTEMWIQLDSDDQSSLDAVNNTPLPKGVFVVHKAREDTIAAKWNRILEQVPDADVFSVAADDDPYVTEGYDASILRAAERFPDGIGMVYGHLANLSFTCSLSATRRWCELLGYLQPEHFPYWFCDHWTDDLAKMTGRISFSDHRTDQSRVGRTQEMREPAWWATLYDACYLIREEEAEKVIRCFDEDVRATSFQIASWPLVHERSRGINESVRQQASQLMQWGGVRSDDERYNRVKQRAIELAQQALADPRMPQQVRDYFTRALKLPVQIPNMLRSA